MRSVSGAQHAPAIEIDRQASREDDRFVGDALAGICKLILWPENTAAYLAAAAKCSTRQAERFLGGHCEWSGAAQAAVITEVLNRRGMRNVKIVPRR
jgi:hypothetical protein